MSLPEPPPLGASMLPNDTYAGVTVVVTGGGTGLGKAIAVEFARLGAAVGIISRGDEHRASGVAAIEAVGGQAVGAAADVRKPDEIAAAFDLIESQLGPASVLVNNAAANFPALAEELSPNAWRAVTSIVLDGTFFCAQQLYRRCTEGGRPGAILNITSTQAMAGGPGTAHSGAAKAAVDNLTKSLAVEWAPAGVRVNAIAPGLFPHDDMTADIQALREGVGGNDELRQPAGRAGRPHELGWAATWLCSPFAAFITGHTLVVDGANMLRRHVAMPEFTPIRTQLRRD